MNLDDWLNAGFSKYQYENYKRYDKLKTTGQPAPGKQVEIILSSLDPDKQSRIMQALQLSDSTHKAALSTSVAYGATVSDVAVRQTAQSLLINAGFVRAELTARIEKDYNGYLQHYFEYTFDKAAIVGYAQLCVVATWLYERVLLVRSAAKTEREYNRYMRSLRANFLEVKPELGLMRSIPASDRRFEEWLQILIERLDKGDSVWHIMEPKRTGNTSAGRFTDEQKNVAEQMYCAGNLSDRQVYDRLIEVGAQRGWWTKEGEYKPIDYVTLNTWLREERNRLELKRSSRVGFYQNVVPVIDRNYPTEKNFCWGVDGTAHNEHIKAFGSTRQHIYVIKVFDYASLRLLNVHVTANNKERESGEVMIATFKEAMVLTGYKPFLVQMDKGPGNLILTQWLESQGIKVLPSQAGVSRTKLVEHLLGMVQQQIVNTLKGWNGQNRTAQSRNARPSQKFFEEGAKSARSYAVASEWLREQLPTLWNTHIIERMAGEPLNKTPDELWQAAHSNTEPLPYESLLYSAGKQHNVKKTKYGIDVQTANEGWRYIPQLADVKKAASVWLAIPNGTRITAFVGEYGEQIAVWQGNTYHGLWQLKERVDMFANYSEDESMRKLAHQMQGFQTEVETLARELMKTGELKYNQLSYIDSVDEVVNNPLPESRRRAVVQVDKPTIKPQGFLDKDRLNTLEVQEKYDEFDTIFEQFEQNQEKPPQPPERGSSEKTPMLPSEVEVQGLEVENQNWRLIKDPDTGEWHRLPLKKTQ